MNIFSKIFAALSFLFIFLTLALVPSTFYTVDPGHTAIQLRLGRVMGIQNVSGFYFKVPFIDSIVIINTQINKAAIETTGMSRDLQTVSVGMVINYKINDVLKLYQEIGTNFDRVIIDPFTQESVKAVIAKFTAEDLIQSRHEAKEKVIQELRDRLAPRYLDLVDFNFIHLDFSPDFIKAVEDKQIAEQSAKTAKNLTAKVQEEALQSRTRAEAEAFALRVKKEAVTKELILLQQVEIQLKAIEKWNGVLPRVNGGALPFLSLGNDVQ
jgi:prohibitin 2